MFLPNGLFLINISLGFLNVVQSINDFFHGSVTSEQIQNLLRYVNKCLETDYSYFGVRFFGGKFGGKNCVTWAIDKLRYIGIQINTYIIPINAAKGDKRA